MLGEKYNLFIGDIWREYISLYTNRFLVIEDENGVLGRKIGLFIEKYDFGTSKVYFKIG